MIRIDGMNVHSKRHLFLRKACQCVKVQLGNLQLDSEFASKCYKREKN